MSQDPLLDKMDALLKKHRGGSQTVLPGREAAPTDEAQAETLAPPPDAWLPVLTDVVVMGTLPASMAEEPNMARKTRPEELNPAPTEADIQTQEAQAVADSPAIGDTLAEQLMVELEPKLAALLQDRVAMQIRSSLDDTVSALLAQLDVNIREIVREAVNEKLGRR